MALKHPRAHSRPVHRHPVAPLFGMEPGTIPRHHLPDGEMPPEVAYQIIRDELMLDGNARLNLATFVTTWMEPQAEQLMAVCLDKNMIDKDEYPQTAELEIAVRQHAQPASGTHPTRSRRPAARRPAPARRRCSAASRSSGAGRRRRAAAGKPADRPNIVMGINVQVCWEKFANYWDVEMRLVPMEGNRFHLSAEEAVKLCDENTIGVVADPRLDLRRLLRAGRRDLRGAGRPTRTSTGLDVPVHVDGASGAFVAPVPRPRPRVGFPAAARGLDQRVGSQVRARLPGRGLDRLARRGGAARGPDLLGQLPRRQHADLRAQLLAARAPRSSPSTTTSCGSGFDGYRRSSSTPATSPPACRRRSPSSGRSSCSPGATSCRSSRSSCADGDRQLHRLRRVERDARARLAAAGLHVPEEPRGPRRAPRRREAGLHPRPGRPARRTTCSGSSPAAEAAGPVHDATTASAFHH